MKSLRVAIFIASRSIMRSNIGVTLMTVAMLVLANLNLLFVPSLVDGIVNSANDKLIDTFSSNIIIESEGDNPVIKRVRELTSRIETIPGVIAATYRSSMGAEISCGKERTSCVVWGIPPDREKEVFEIEEAVFEGSSLDARDLDQILLGVQLAGSDRREIELYSSSLKRVHAGDRVSVTYANGVEKQYLVKGVFYTQFIQTDRQAFVSEREFLSVDPLANNRASRIHVKTKNDSQMAGVIGEIAALRDDLKFQTWGDTAGIVKSMTGSFTIIKGILTVVNLLVAGITIFIVTYVDLVNRSRQIGVERAIGITEGAVVASYVLRAVFYAGLGIIVSALLYIYVVLPLEARYPFHFPFGDVTLFMDRALLMRSALTILGVTILAAFLPVRRTIRIKLLDAIWG